MSKELLQKEWIAPAFQKVVVIGTGGTGSYLVQGLCKLIAGYNLPVELVLVDPDVVEEKNVHRQNFCMWECDQPKAKVLAFRLSQMYGLAIESHVEKGEEYCRSLYAHHQNLIVCCVDSPKVRVNLKEQTPMLDLGNGLEHGQAIFGNSSDKEACRMELDNWDSTPLVENLPTPVLKTGMEKLAKGRKKAAVSCADNPFSEQSVFVNEFAAQAGLTILHQLLITQRLKTPAIYFDCGRGRMNPAKLTKSYFQL